MKKHKLILLWLAVILIAAGSFTGCNARDKLELVNAIEKSSKLNSWESHSQIRLTKAAFDTNIEDLALMQMFVPLFDNLTIETHQKVNKNSSGTQAIMQTDTKVVSGDISEQTSIWAAYDFEKQPPAVRQIIKLPDTLALSLPEDLAGKEYFVMDQMDLPDDAQLSTAEYAEMMESMSNFQSDLIGLLKEHALQHPDFVVVNQLEDRTVNGEQLSVYQLKLDNESFRTVLRYILTELSDNEQSKDVIKELISVMGSVSEGTEAGIDMEMAFDALTNGDAKLKEEIGRIMSALSGVTMLGSRGIEINFIINRDGNIVNQNGVLDFYIDSQQIEDAFEKLGGDTAYDGREIYKFTFGIAIEFDTDISRINQEVAIDFPVTTEQNSFDFDDFAGISPSFSRNLVERYNSAARIDFSNSASGSVMPVKLGDKTFVPLEPVCKVLGSKLMLKNNGEFSFAREGVRISGKAGSREIVVNDNKQQLPLPVMKIENQIFAPEQLITQYLSTGMYYNEKTRELIIQKK